MKNFKQTEPHLINQLMNSMLLWWVFLSFFALWFSLSRSQLTGWGIRENIHIFCFFLILIVTIARHHLSAQVKAAIFILFQLTVAVIGVYSFGLMSPAILFLPMMAVILSLFLSHQVVLLFSIAVLLFVAVTGYAFQADYLTLSVDANALFQSPEHWFLYVLCLAIFLLFVGIAIFQYRKNVAMLVNEIQLRNREIEFLANHDDITGLPLMQVALDTFDCWTGHDGTTDRVAFMLIDINKFKTVNDAYGHDAGDICLIHVANKISRILNHNHVICRLGGDEFLVLQKSYQSESELLQKAEEMSQVILEPFMYKGQQLSISASIGIAFYPRHGERFTDLKRAADRAMLTAKSPTTPYICMAAE